MSNWQPGKSLQIVKKFEPNVTDQIQKALHSLATSKAQVFTADRIVYFVTEFENLQMPLPEILDRIRAVHYKKTYGEIQFSDFVDINLDDVFPSDVIFRRALTYIDNNQNQLSNLCKKLYGTDLISTEQKTKVLDFVSKAEASYYDTQFAIRHAKASEELFEKAKEMFALKENIKKTLEDYLRKGIKDIVEQELNFEGANEMKISMLNTLATTINLKIFNILKEI